MKGCNAGLTCGPHDCVILIAVGNGPRVLMLVPLLRGGVKGIRSSTLPLRASRQLLECISTLWRPLIVNAPSNQITVVMTLSFWLIAYAFGARMARKIK